MTRCNCGPDPSAVRIAREMGFSTKDIDYVECRHCKKDREHRQEMERRIEEREVALEHFMSLSKSQKWEEVFNFMYERGWRP